MFLEPMLFSPQESGALRLHGASLALAVQRAFEETNLRMLNVEAELAPALCLPTQQNRWESVVQSGRVA